LKFPLDATALLPLITQSGKQLLAKTAHEDLITTDLTIYEACNSLWKLATLLKTITEEEAADVAALLSELTAKNLIQTTSYANIDLPQTLVIAQKAQLTFYDASYIAAAQKTKAILATEDQRLRKAADKYVKTSSFSQLQNELAKNHLNTD
jgi:predicted nucleic acid-binding protein